MDAKEVILERVWNAALDASRSPDFRLSDGSLNEEAYLHYQKASIEHAKTALRIIFEKENK